MITRLAVRVVLLSPLLTGLIFVGDTATGGGDISTTVTDYILKGGPFGIVLMLFILDKLDTTGERNLLRKQLAESQERERALNQQIQSDIVPAVTESNRLNNEVLRPLLDRVVHALEKTP